MLVVLNETPPAPCSDQRARTSPPRPPHSMSFPHLLVDTPRWEMTDAELARDGTMDSCRGRRMNAGTLFWRPSSELPACFMLKLRSTALCT